MMNLVSQSLFVEGHKHMKARQFLKTATNSVCQGIHLCSDPEGRIPSFKTKLHLALNPTGSELWSLPAPKVKIGLLKRCIVWCSRVLLVLLFVRDEWSCWSERKLTLLLVCHLGCYVSKGFSLHFKNYNGNEQGARRK